MENFRTFSAFLTILFACFFFTPSVTAQAITSAIKPSKENITLTFDDGPDPRYTIKILDILDQYDVKATFFVTGEKAKQYPHLIEEIYKRGHPIANHTMNHPMLTRISEKKLHYQLGQTSVIVEKIIGVRPTCLRPPYGKHNRRVDDLAKHYGMRVLNWDLNSFDYNRPGVNKLTQWVLTKSHPGYVILMHDGGGNRSQTVAALPAIIEGFKKKGLGFEAICKN